MIKNILEKNKNLKDELKTMKKQTFYVTTPIYYANGPAHLGGAYTTIAADTLARWHKLLDKDVFFLTGTDEHGQKIQEIAEEKRLNPKKFVDSIVKKWKEVFKILNISNDNFIRTTDKKHVKEVQKMLQMLYDKGFIYKGEYESYYCVGCEQYLTKSDLVDGKCPLHQREPELKKEEAYLFKLSKFETQLAKLIKEGKLNIIPKKRRKEIIKFIESGLEDVSISRLKEKIYWGIELPFDKKHCAWVWPDALWNYLTGLKEKKAFDKFWPANVQLMARDILRVHSTIWPALLLATKNELPKTLFIHGYFTVNGQKMSKSLGNVIDPLELSKKYNPDSIRYYLMRNIPFGEDGDVSEKALIDRHNNELANKLGNLISRVFTLAEKYKIEKTPNKLLEKINLKQIEKLMSNYELDKALNKIFTFIDICNEYIQKNKIWETKNKKQLYELIDSIKAITILLWPFIPETSEKIAKQLNIKLKLSEINKPYKVQNISKSEILFKKIDFVQEKTKQIEGIKKMNQIKFSEWEKLDLRVARILKAEDIPEADKLYKLEIDLGNEKRIICAGIKQHYSKQDLKNKKIIIITNLEPRKIKGIESKGMLLAAVNKKEKTEKLSLITPDNEIEPGTKIS